MSEKLNHFVCPNCGHDFYTSCAYATCDACHTFFYAGQSQTCKPKDPSWKALEQIGRAHV